MRARQRELHYFYCRSIQRYGILPVRLPPHGRRTVFNGCQIIGTMPKRAGRMAIKKAVVTQRRAIFRPLLFP